MSSSFNVHTVIDEVVKTFPDRVEGKTIALTGPSTGGLGAGTAIGLAKGKPRMLLLLARSEAKVAAVLDEIKSVSPSTTAVFVPLDLLSYESIRSAAQQITAHLGSATLDILINCAGIMAIDKFTPAPTGIESQFAANHIGHFLLTNLLVPRLTQPGARIVSVSSNGYLVSPIHFDNWNFGPAGAAYDKWTAYAQSKTANVLFARSLAAKLAARGITAASLHPGMIPTTNLGNHVDWSTGFEEIRVMFAKVNVPMVEAKTLDEGCAVIAVAALDPALESGAYVNDCQPIEIVPHGRDMDAAEKLWKLSEELVGEQFAY